MDTKAAHAMDGESPSASIGEELGSVDPTTKRGLKPRHSQMIAMGACIGTGLFVGSGATLAKGGPAFTLAGYILLCALVYFVVTAIVEVAAYLPVPGGTMSYYGSRNVSQSLGFAMGWLYFYSMGILLPTEITAAALVIDYWNSPVNVAVWLSIFIVVIVILNLLPVQFFGETEYWFASLKIFLIVGLLILSFILFWGGGPQQHGILGFHYWKDPGATNTFLVGGRTGTFLAFVGTVISAAYPFAFAAEFLVVTGGEMKSPRLNLPRAARYYFWRLIVFYVGGILAISVICPYNDARLTSGGSGAKASPFVVGIFNAGIRGLDSVINAVILTAAWSSGNSFLYMSSRSLYSLAVAGNAPAIFKRCSKNGVPYYAVAAASCFAPLSYLNVSNNGSVVFNWFVNLTTQSGFISFICCCIIYLRFRKAVAVQGIVNELPYRSTWTQPYGAYLALASFTLLSIINGFDVFFPGRFTASSFLTAYIGIPLFLFLYFGHRFTVGRHDKWAYDSEDVDLTTGVQDIIDGEIQDVEDHGQRSLKQKIVAWLV